MFCGDRNMNSDYNIVIKIFAKKDNGRLVSNILTM